MYLRTYLPTYLPIYLPIYIYIPTYLSTYLSILLFSCHLSIACLFVCLVVCLLVVYIVSFLIFRILGNCRCSKRTIYYIYIYVGMFSLLKNSTSPPEFLDSSCFLLTGTQRLTEPSGAATPGKMASWIEPGKLRQVLIRVGDGSRKWMSLDIHLPWFSGTHRKWLYLFER